MENGATRLESVVDDRELDDTVPYVFNVEGHIGARFSTPSISGRFIHSHFDSPLRCNGVPGVRQPAVGIGFEDDLLGVAHHKPD